MSEREVICDVCRSDPATCVEQHSDAGSDYSEDGGDTINYGSTIVACSTCCDHKSPHRCLPIVRYERGKEFDE